MHNPINTTYPQFLLKFSLWFKCKSKLALILHGACFIKGNLFFQKTGISFFVEIPLARVSLKISWILEIFYFLLKNFQIQLITFHILQLQEKKIGRLLKPPNSQQPSLY
jgi:hypothetical protein